MKATDGEIGACIRLDKDHNILAEDGTASSIILAMTNYLNSKGFALTTIEE